MVERALAVKCPEHGDTFMTVIASWAFRGGDGRERPRLSLDVAFDGLPPLGNWRVHTVTLRCPDCDATLELFVR
jgi:hypothetical protein